MVMTSPGRTGSWKVTIVLSIITASGRPNRSLRSKCTWQRHRPGCVCPGPSCGAGTRAESIVGGRIGPSVSAAATPSSQKSGLPFSTEAHEARPWPRSAGNDARRTCRRAPMSEATSSGRPDPRPGRVSDTRPASGR